MKDKMYVLRLSKELHAKIKSLCAHKGISMQKFIEELIKDVFENST